MMMTMPKMMVIGRPTTMARNLLMKMLMMMMMAVVAAAQIVDGHADHDGWLLSTAITTGSAFENATFDCHRSGMECLHDGICAQDGTRCDCSQTSQWFGPRCELRRCAHPYNPCENGAECEKTAQSFKCHCRTGFAGTLCERRLPTICDWPNNPCVHGACLVGASPQDYKCDCHYNYTGPNCSLTNYCQNDPCLNGRCLNDPINGGSHCECRPGWKGEKCELDVDECLVQAEDAVCQNGGTCNNTIGAFYCACPPGFVGEFCEQIHHQLAAEEEPCQNQNPCLNGGTCRGAIVATTAMWALDARFDWQWECECPPGFGGKHCEQLLDQCTTRPPCLNGGQCARPWVEEVQQQNMANGTLQRREWHPAQCKCPPGFEGEFCDQHIDECTRYSGGLCQNGGTCTNQQNGEYACICIGGFEGKHCEVDIDDCVNNLCYAGSTCSDQVARYVCHCAPDRIGTYCENQNQCYDDPCVHGQCQLDYEKGNYTCQCDHGWTGQNCTEDVDECSNPSTNLCYNGQCVNLEGEFKCECEAGFTGDLCMNPVRYCDGQPCQNGATCLNHETGDYDCLCLPGYSGKNCEIRSYQEQYKCRLECQNGGVCRNASAQQCECLPPFAGILCEIEKPDPCEFNHCAKGSICAPNIDYVSYKCQCPPFLAGERCEQRLAPCEGGYNPCVHGQCHRNDFWETTTPEHQQFRCDCIPGWIGPLCDQEKDVEIIDHNHHKCPLHENPCLHGGQCVGKQQRGTGATFFECICPHGFTGPLCETVPVEMNCGEGGGCRNGGQCRKVPKDDISWHCECPIGFEGSQCEIELNPCTKYPYPCKHKGKCVNLGNNRFRCDCAPGWTGDTCEENPDDCENVVCANGGVCHDRVNNFMCECTRGFTGRHCEVSVPVDKFNRTDMVDRDNCAKAGCEARAGDGRCDPECNLFACHFDGGDCSTKQAQPFDKCPQSSYCAHVFADGKCDEICNTERCLFDGFDCLNRSRSRCPRMEECAKLYANGHCDEQCNQASCGWDGGDCDHDHDLEPDHREPPQVLPGELFLVLAVRPAVLFVSPALLREFLVSLSAHLRASLALSMDQNDGKPKLYEWRSDKGIGARVELPPQLNITSLFSVRYEERRAKRGIESEAEQNDTDPALIEGIALFLQVDVTMCNMIGTNSFGHPQQRIIGVHTLCFSDMESVAAYVGAANAKKSLQDIPVQILQSEARIPAQTRLHFWLGMLAVCMVATVSATAVTVFTRGRIQKGRKMTAKTWKPEIYDPKPVKAALLNMCGTSGTSGGHAPLVVGPHHPFNPYSAAPHHHQLVYNTSAESCASSAAASNMPLIRHADSMASLASNASIGNGQQQQSHFAPFNHHHYQQSQHHQLQQQFHSYALAQQQQHQCHQQHHQYPVPSALAVPAMSGTNPQHIPQTHQQTLSCSRSSSSGIGGSSTEHSPLGLGHTNESDESRKLLDELRHAAYLGPKGLLDQEDKLEPCLINAPNERRRTLLHLLFENPYLMDPKKDEQEQCLLQNLRLLFSKGAEINALDIDDTTALLLAARNHKLQAVKMLVRDFEADQNLADLDGCTPLYAACEFGLVQIAQFLIGEAIGTKLDGLAKRKETPLMRCALMPGKNWVRIAELMIEKVEPECRMDFVNQIGDASFLGFTGKSALHWAAECNNAPMVELLIRHGANREATDMQGRTPLFAAVELGQYYSAEALLRLHADRNKTDITDTKISELLTRPGFEPIAELFKQMPEQPQHHQHHQHQRFFVNATSSLQQRPAPTDGKDDGARKTSPSGTMTLKAGTKRPRAVTKRSATGSEEKSKASEALAKKRPAILQSHNNDSNHPRQQIENSGPQIITPPLPHNVLTPPNSDNSSAYSTSSPSPQNNSSTSSTNGAGGVITTAAAQHQHQHQQQRQNQKVALQGFVPGNNTCTSSASVHQAMFQQAAAMQQQKHQQLQNYYQLQQQQLLQQQMDRPSSWVWHNTHHHQHNMPLSTVITGDQQLDQKVISPPNYSSPVYHHHLMPSSCGSADASSCAVGPSMGHAMAAPAAPMMPLSHPPTAMSPASDLLNYPQHHHHQQQLDAITALHMMSHQFSQQQHNQEHHQQQQNGDNFRSLNSSLFAGIGNFDVGDQLSHSLEDLEDLVPDQHVTMDGALR